MNGYDEEDWLQISGLQHFAFCRRQWALIHIEQLWDENWRTAEGEILHTHAHDERLADTRKDLRVVRGLRVHARSLGVSGSCDVVEFRQSPDGVPVHGHRGLWLPMPVEYKRGHTKENDADRLQLCCQAMCLEEMLGCEVPRGCLFYGETRRREQVALTPDLREEVRAMLKEMHMYFARGYTPQVKPSKSCNACAIKDLCLPKLCTRLSASAYLQKSLQEDKT